MKLALLVLVPAVYGLLFVWLRPSMNNDAGSGFTILKAMREGAPFNTLIVPDPANLANSLPSFIAAWSPSQYQLPALFQIGGLDVGQGTALATTVCICLGLLGWYALYRALGFAAPTALLTCALMLTFRHTMGPFSEYNGGEPILFGAAPWSALLVWRAREMNVGAAFVATLAALLLATYAKLSGVLFVGALIGGIAFVHLRHRLGSAGKGSYARPLILAARDAAPMVLAWLVFAVLLQVFWVSRGWTAVEASAVRLPFSIGHVIMPFVSTVLGSLSLEDALGFSQSLPVIGPLMRHHLAIYALLAPVCGTLLVVAARQLWPSLADAVLLVLIAAGLYALAFVVLYLHGAALYYSDRFFRPASLLLLPLLVSVAMHGSARWLRIMSRAGVAAFVIYGVVATISHVVVYERSPVGALGVRQPAGTPELLDRLHTGFGRPDPQHPDRIVVFGNIEMAIEIGPGRVLTRFIENDPLEVLKALSYRGRVSEIAVFLPQSALSDGRAEALLAAFKDYPADGWRRTLIGKRFVEFRQ